MDSKDLSSADIVFVHIPKTAGTSLREALFRARPAALNLCDYGPTSPTTSPQIMALRYGAGGLPELRAALGAAPVTISGHLNAMKYAKAFPGAALVTVLRDPAARVMSEYLHVRRHEGFGGSLLDYAAEAHHRDRQAQFLDRVPLRAFAFVAVQERLDTDAPRLALRLDLALTLPRLNVTPARGRPTLTAAVREQIEAWNPADVALYREACALGVRG